MKHPLLIALLLGLLTACAASYASAPPVGPNLPGSVVVFAMQRDGTCCEWEHSTSSASSSSIAAQSWEPLRAEPGTLPLVRIIPTSGGAP